MEYYNEITIAGNVTFINYGTSKTQNNYASGFIQCYQDGEYKGKEYKKDYISLKFIAFGEVADMLNALGIVKGSDVKLLGYLKSTKNPNDQSYEITLVIKESLETESKQRKVGNQSYNNDFFNDKPSTKTPTQETIDDDLPF